MQAAGSTLSTKPAAQTIARSAATAAERYGDRPALRHRSGDGWAEVTFAQAAEVVEEAALGLLTLGVEPGDRVCLLANTRVDWTDATSPSEHRGRRRAGVPVELARGVRVGGGQLGGARHRLRGREPGGEDHAVRDALPALEASS